jgi:hypothetical protein
VVAFEAVIPVGAFDTLDLSGVTPNIGHTFPGFGNSVTVDDGSVVAVVVAVLLFVLPPPEQPHASATPASASPRRITRCRPRI